MDRFSGIRARAVFLIALLALAPCTAAKGENGPEGWTRTNLRDHNVTVRQFMKGDDTKTASLLIAYEFAAPTVVIDLEAAADSALSFLGIDTLEQAAVETIPGAVLRQFSASQRGGPIHTVSIAAFETGSHQHVLLFAALPDAFRRLGGADFMLYSLSTFPSVAALRGAQNERFDAIGQRRRGVVIAKNTAGIALTERGFGAVVDLLEIFSGTRLSAQQIRSFRDAAIAGWRADDTPTDEAPKLFALLTQINNMSPSDKIKVVVNGYSNILKDANAKGDENFFVTFAKKLNSVLAERNGDVLTERALKARLRSIELYLQWSGANEDEIRRALEKAAKQLPADFRTMSDASRRHFTQAQVRWYTIWRSTAGWTDAQKIEAAEAARTWSKQSTNLSTLGEALESQVMRSVQQADILKGLGTIMILPDLQNARPR